jgi:hypothetical protein
MTIAYTLEKENRFVYFTAEGEISVEELIAEIEEIIAEPDYGEGYDALIDISHLVPAVSVNNLKMKTLGSYIKSIEDKVGESKWAFFAPRFIQHTFSYLLTQIVKSKKIEMRVFKNEAKAREWLDS